MTTQEKRKWGFALLPKHERQALASLGGQAAHRSGRAYQFSRDDAVEAARRSVETRRAKALAKKQQANPAA